MSATKQVADLPALPVQLRKLAEMLENTSPFFRSDADRARLLAQKIEAREAADHGR